MSKGIAIVGNSGTGKSTSIGHIPELGIEGLPPEETFIINVKGKPLPFKGSGKKYNVENKNYVSSNNPKTILKALEKANSFEHIKYVIIDDAQYIMGDEFMRTALVKGYEKYNKLAHDMYSIVTYASEMREDVFVIFMFHLEETNDNSYKIKTIGKMLDTKITLEGVFTMVLYTRVINDESKIKYQFITNNDGIYPAKTPYGMFENLYIPNDMDIVIQKAKKYYENE